MVESTRPDHFKIREAAREYGPFLVYGLWQRHSATLARRPVWLFSVGSFGDRHPIVGGLMKKEPREISEFEQTVHPRDYRVFAGVIDLDHWPAWGRLLFKALGGHAGDNRQSPDIDAWAEKISQEIRAQD